jgi:hypothetical protein
MQARYTTVIVSVVVLITALSLAFRYFSAPEIDFNADIRPILNTRCISCHGGVKESGGFSLFSREDALKTTKSGKPAIIPGDASASELIRRLILPETDEEHMPLHSHSLSEEEISKLKIWINQGVKWQQHWAYIPPVMPEVPTDKSGWAENPVDNFILQKIKENKLNPSSPANKATLLRRLSLDLIGLPPTEKEADDFEKDNTANAYEKQVDRLLASPHFGERWAAMWLDLARYSDSKGYEKDDMRNIWRFRDYVIQAFNEDKPFDKFTIEQLAGDLVSEPTQTQLIATAFHRNTANNDEGGTDDEEFRTAALIDRVNNTWETWQGMTMGCVQCHSHPYDPIKHEEFYESLAFFNNTRDEDVPSEAPTFTFYQPDDEAKIEALKIWLKSELPQNQVANAAHELEKLLRVTEPKIHPHSFDSLTNAALIDGKWLGGGHKGSAVLRNINLTGKTQMLLSHTIDQNGSWLEIRKDKPNGEVLASYQIKKGASVWNRNDYQKVFVPIKSAEGIHTLYFSFFNPTYKNPEDYVVSIEWLLFLPDLPGQNKTGFQSKRDTIVALLNRKNTDKTPILQENNTEFHRKSFVFTRGNWLTKGKEIHPQTPGMMPDFSKYPQNRLGFSQWLVSRDNPLTARVTVNRFWEQIFGTGIVETLEDFGSQGIKPTHPELLDYLALTFRDDYKWSVKKLLKLIVMSATYQQDSKVSPDALQKDPTNRWLVRGARVRLTAEQVRDQALAVSNILSLKMYGKSVMPPQPEGVWQVVYNGAEWKTSKGEDAFRRAIYTFWRRSVPYPSMITFDAAGREICQSRRIRTNTPLQALVTLNDTVYVTAARGLASRMLKSNTVDAQIKSGYKLILFREITPEKFTIFKNLYQKAYDYYSSQPQEVVKFLGKQAALLPDAKKQAALTVVANAMLNLDEFVMKE